MCAGEPSRLARCVQPPVLAALQPHPSSSTAGSCNPRAPTCPQKARSAWSWPHTLVWSQSPAQLLGLPWLPRLVANERGGNVPQKRARQRLGRVGKGGGASAGKLHAGPCFQSQSSAMDALICNLLNHPRQTEGQDAETQQRVVVVSQPQPPFCTRVPGNLGGRAWLQPQGTVSPGQQCLPTLMASHNVGRTDSPPNTPAPLPPPTPAPPALAGWRWSAAASACAASLLDGHSAVRVQQPHDGGRLLRAARAARVMLL